MIKKGKNSNKMILVIGVLGLIAGIALIFSDDKMIGIFGAIASAGLIFNNYKQ